MTPKLAALEARPVRLGVSVPRACRLTNGSYAVLLTSAGTGESSLPGCALTAWAGDPVEDRDGYFFYLRDLANDDLWSAGHQPVRRDADRYESAWSPGRFEIVRLDHEIESRLRVCVANDAALEIRRITLTNLSNTTRRIEVTSYAEVVLQSAAAHAAHPEFSRLFVETEFVPETGALLARRRPRRPDERTPWLLHAIVEGGPVEFDTCRTRFVGRGRSLASPAAFDRQAPLAGATGNVLDPIVSLRRTVEIEPGGAVDVTFLLGAADDRDQALATVERWISAPRTEQAFERAELRERDILYRLGLAEERAAEYQALAAAMLYGRAGLRHATHGTFPTGAADETLARHGIRDDHALILLHAGRPENTPRLGRWIRAVRYWRAAGVPCEMMLLCDEARLLPSDFHPRGKDSHRVHTYAEIGEADHAGLEWLAKLVVPPEPGEALLVEPAHREHENGAPPPDRSVALEGRLAHDEVPPIPLFEEPLDHWNGIGGFTVGGSEYVIRLEHRPGEGWVRPPRPWINVIANEQFGFLCSETGAGPTWCGNSREHRLTPWSDDPLLDPHGEALYLRDEDSGEVWSPLPGPVPAAADYEMRHGFGSSTCRHRSAGLDQETTLFVPRHDPVKIVRLRLTSLGPARRLTLYAYQRLVLGARAEDSGSFIVTEIDPTAEAAFARNPMAPDFAERVAFAAAVIPPGAGPVRFTCDRESFIGRHAGPECPAAPLAGSALDGRDGAGIDPCFATQVSLELPAGATVEVAFLFGEGGVRSEAETLIGRYREDGAIEQALTQVRAFWSDLLGRVRIQTPVPALDLMVNGWLGYQTLSCRMWARSAFYQSGGAFGFRDQLQDSSALAWLDPALTRDQILAHAGHQFEEGDVLHWWHPPHSLGTRTRFADDLLWLPYLTADYVARTGDTRILEENVRYLTAQALQPGEDELFLRPVETPESGDLYQHCCRAIDRSLALGSHGLPLFGTGDWNDGMNRVGREGRGESVWMGFFLHAVLGNFIPLCEKRDDRERVENYHQHRERLRAALEDFAWDGEWYLRGTYDNGELLGSSSSDECRIDALVQAWAVISHAADAARARQAMHAVERNLVSESDRLIRLLAPPFSKTASDPGYIKGYAPGVRENGGQYTHAALWVVRAMAELGWNDRAARLLEMLSPISHGGTAERIATYGVEPYVIAADVCGAPPYVGRGGWTWYTGSSGWMLRVVLESLLGLSIEAGRTLVIRPRVPDAWPSFRARLRSPGGQAVYDVTVVRSGSGASTVIEAKVNGDAAQVVDGAVRVPIAESGTHRVDVTLA